MWIQITVRAGEREVESFEREVTGTAAEREEQAHAIGREVGRELAEQALGEVAQEAPRPHCCGRAMENKGWRRLRLQGLDGQVSVRRRRYRCSHCGHEVYAADGWLQCGRHAVTKPLAQRACQLATLEHFTQLPQLLFDQLGARLSHEELIELVHDVGGAAEREREAAAQAWLRTPPAQRVWPTLPAGACAPRRIYVSCDGIMYCTNQREPDPEHPGQFRLIWQQMRVGCVYWQDAREQWHKRIIWGRGTAEEFGARLYHVACRCGYREATERIFAADGADWCWEIGRRYFGDATGVLDWFHASEHVWQTARDLRPESGAATWAAHALEVLHDSGGEGLLKWLLPQQSAARGRRRTALTALVHYVQPRLDRMDYPTYRRHDWQIGTGMIESTARQRVGVRLKGPGMHWSEAGALAMTALRATSLNGDWHTFWNTLVLNC